MADNVNNVTDSTFQAEVIDASNTQPVMVGWIFGRNGAGRA